jgi:hypothetical protein
LRDHSRPRRAELSLADGIFRFPLGSPAPEVLVLRFSLFRWQDVLRRVGDHAIVGADELDRLVASVAWQALQVRAG